MEDGFFTVDYESMACVVTALVAHNIFSPFSQKIDNLPFTFVTPLGAQYDDVVTHFFKITVCLKMDSTTAFLENQHFFRAKFPRVGRLLPQPIVFLNM